MEDRAFALFCRSRPRGFWQLKSPGLQEFDIQGQKIPGGGGRGGKCTVFTICFICSGMSLDMCMN